jgi:hypothetical protein
MEATFQQLFMLRDQSHVEFVVDPNVESQMRTLLRGVSMLRSMIGIRWSLCPFALVLAVLPAGAQAKHTPEIGAQVPQYVLKARTHSQQCFTYTNRRDPCASVKIDGWFFTIAWDAQTKAIVYIFTDDHRLVTDSELSVGGSCRLVDEAEQPDETSSYMGWAIMPQWADTVRDLSGDAVWYAALRKDTSNPEYGQIVGFLQSRYLKSSQ